MGICASLNEEKAKLGGVAQYQKLATYSSIKQTDKVIEDRNIKAPVRKKPGESHQKYLRGMETTLEELNRSDGEVTQICNIIKWV